AAVTVSNVDMPRTSATLAPGQLSAAAELTGPAGWLGVLAIALPRPPFVLPGVDPSWLDGATAVIQTAGLLGASPLTSSTTLPAPGAFPGYAVTWQGFAFGPAGALRVANPATVVLQ
ncbi:MAG: hypothetical protein KAI24_18035, partial [Planctomycetes bacterium]|nr:hypothetical protein [Planctomycetota bacterium]